MRRKKEGDYEIVRSLGEEEGKSGLGIGERLVAKGPERALDNL